MTQVPDELPILDPAALERLRALAVAVARPGEDVLGHLAGLFIDDSAQRRRRPSATCSRRCTSAA